MRVLQVLPTLNIGSGIANFVMNYLREINREEIQFDFLLCAHAPNNFEQEAAALGARIFVIEKPSVTTVSKYKRNIKRFFREHAGEWDCLHIHLIQLQSLLAGPARRFGVKCIFIHSHTAEFVFPKEGLSPFRNKLYMALKRLRNAILFSGIERRADVCCACSDEAAVALFGRKILKKEKYAMVPNAIDVSRYAFDGAKRESYRDALSLNGKKVILHVGRFGAEKNHPFLLRFFARLHGADSSWALLLAGDGSMKELIHRQATELGIADSVRFLGNRADVPELLSASDIFVFPSIREGLGIALIEAQANGLPCIASTGVPAEAQISPCVRFLPAEDGDESLWANELSQHALARFDGAAYLKKSKFDLRKTAAALEKLYIEGAAKNARK